MLQILKVGAIFMHTASLLVALSKQIAQDHPLRDNLRWVWADRQGGDGIAVPAMGPRLLYRGQNRLMSPCWPSICRDFKCVRPNVFELLPQDRNLLIKRLAQGRWFEKTLDEHPAVKWASKHKVHINRPALAQHYGIPTGYIDLTEKFDVAAFFATCYLDAEKKAWSASKGGQGVLYRLPWKNTPTEPNRISWIGLQTMPRPAEQWAWTYELFLGENFEDAPSLQTIRFSHDCKVGEHFLELFNGGDAVIPSDPLADVADRITKSTKMPSWALDDTIADLVKDPRGLLGVSPDQLRSDVKSEFKLELEDKCPSLLTSLEIDELTNLWNEREKKFLNGVGVALVRERKPLDPDGKSHSL